MAVFPPSLNVLNNPLTQVGIASAAILLFLIAVFIASFSNYKPSLSFGETIDSYCRFIYGCFLKPHSGDGSGSQQDALESFYKAQASVYDATRQRLLHGREDMLGLVAAQSKHRTETEALARKPVWVDIGGGTGYNIEAMSKFLDVPTFFKTVYLVDFSPSLCNVAVARFERLGWHNVKVLCQDARSFRLKDHEETQSGRSTPTSAGKHIYESGEASNANGADLVTMSYSLSMIPEFYSVIDSITSLLAPTGILGVADFYVQSKVDYQCRNYTGGDIDRHCNWGSRVFWRGWFEIDRVSLEAARRDYLEYRFGTIISVNARNHFCGVRIPYYIWIGCPKETGSSGTKLAELDAAATESPYLSALDLQRKSLEEARKTASADVHSKAYESAIVNLAASLPLPASWYQSHHWRIYYDPSLPKHKQFNSEYIYAFTWEDARADARILKIQEDDVILAITSAGDNTLSYALQQPRRIHAVDLNPAQNHLLELKVAAFTALGYADVWKLFGEGKHSNFRSLLIEQLSPHMSSLAFQFWLHHGERTFGKRGLYYTGGSRHALNLVKWLFRLLGVTQQVERLCAAQTLNEQREIWHKSVRRVLLSRILSWTIVGNERWLWKALGVPPAQREMIEQDYLRQSGIATTNEHEILPTAQRGIRSGRAIWEYMVNTLDPIVNSTLVSDENHYYLLCLQGCYSRRCHPEYLTPKAHTKLSRPNAFDGLRIHTDEMNEVIARMTPSTLTIAVLMDSMDWMEPKSSAAREQISKLQRALKVGGRVLVRSAGLNPWYVKDFENGGFLAKRVAARLPGSCIDRVNMYASTWLFTKSAEDPQQVPEVSIADSHGSLEKLNI
ncbi:MAG: hypothetical protein M1821_001386 [Bathelium mastoideum]|nr:MAG: hypothetical protein M1821_001386 [Bathelium mastoideum]KAI9689914.1 MAG: hypothetical protein M1822_009796 [Bathelium mastoideum]